MCEINLDNKKWKNMKWDIVEMQLQELNALTN